MSKCEISIEFDRPDRVYRGGETVNGHVRIRVNQDVKCNGIKLTHFWKTHGQGNIDAGERHEQQLVPSRQLLRGETLRFPFSFVSEREPVTYRGHYINIDHYVHVEIDVPWAFDPEAEEEFLVRPGKPPERLSGSPDAMLKPKKTSSWILAVVLFVVVAVFFALAITLAIVVVPILLLAGLIFWIVKMMLKGRLGEVELIAPKVVVAPGETWPVELRFTPRRSFTMNAITVKILAQESATAGSGSNAKTHKHTIFEEAHMLHPPDTLMGGKPFYRQTALALPETDAFSFDSSDNHVQWSVEVRIDMPGFPDWSQNQALQMVPREFLQGVPTERGVVAKWR